MPSRDSGTNQESAQASELPFSQGISNGAEVPMANQPVEDRLVHLIKLLEAQALLDTSAKAFWSRCSGKTFNDVGIITHRSADLGAVMTFVRALALGLGACPDCWGQSQTCPVCNGQGKPGFFLPEPRHFDALVRPAVEKAKNRQS